MAVIPTGAPAWIRSNDHTTYGGDLNKENYQAQGAVNARTDVTAQNYARVAADLAAVARVAPFCVLTFTMNDTSPAAPTIDNYDTMAGGNPTGARLSDGRCTFTWDASYTDPYSVSGDIDIRHVIATVHGSGSPAFAIAALSDPDANSKNERVQIEVVDDAGAAVADPKVTIVVYTGGA